jgi:hypothetical protein
MFGPLQRWQLASHHTNSGRVQTGRMMDREMNSRGVRENNVISLRTFDIDRKSPICSDIPNVVFLFLLESVIFLVFRTEGKLRVIAR